jgi:hypothetical protein
MEYGIWISKKGTVCTLKECRHHGLEVFRYSYPNWRCHECKKQERKVSTRKIPGCATYIGIEIAEKVLQKAFKFMEKANPLAAYDFVCGKGLKVDSKCATLSLSHGQNHSFRQWAFAIRKNKIPDVFCLIALDNTSEDMAKDPKPIHVWLIPGNAIIDGRALNDRMSLSVTPTTIARLNSWRRIDMEGKIIKCCTQIKGVVESG